MDDTRRNEIGATVFAILMGVSALSFTGWLFAAGGCSDQSAEHEIITDDAAGIQASDSAETEQPPAPSAFQAEYDAEIEAEAARRAELAEENRVLKADLKAAEAGNDLTEKVRELEAEIEELKGNKVALGAALNENKTLAAALTATKSDLAVARQEGVDWEGKFNLASKTEGTLKTNLADLTGKFVASTKAEADLKAQLAASLEKAKEVDMAKSEAGKLRGRVTDLEKKLNDLSKEKLALEANAKSMTADGEAMKKLQAEMAAIRKKSADDAKTVADKLAAAEKRLADANKSMNAGADEAAKKLQAELDAAKKKAADDAAAWGTTKSKLAKENEALKKQLDELKKKLDAKPAAMPEGAAFAPAAEGLPELDLPLLVNNPAKLNPTFKDLFGNLRGIEDSPEAREKAYTALTGGGKYKPSLQIPFSSGSDFIGGPEKMKIDALAKAAEEGAKFLVVGYASTDGSNETNYRLSSQRASKVGQQLADKLGSTDNVQAVYFGQTGRFSDKKGPNRVVEIWRVK